MRSAALAPSARLRVGAAQSWFARLPSYCFGQSSRRSLIGLRGRCRVPTCCSAVPIGSNWGASGRPILAHLATIQQDTSTVRHPGQGPVLVGGPFPRSRLQRTFHDAQLNLDWMARSTTPFEPLDALGLLRDRLYFASSRGDILHMCLNRGLSVRFHEDGTQLHLDGTSHLRVARERDSSLALEDKEAATHVPQQDNGGGPLILQLTQ